MDRRNFLKTTGTFIAGATIARSALATTAADANATPGRLVLPMNRNWRFSRTVAEGAHARDFDDSGYERVVIPHTNVRLPWHSFDEKTYEFVSIYRRRFDFPPEARGQARLRRLRRGDDGLHRLDQWHSGSASTKAGTRRSRSS